jgi:hypothetical protein
MWQDQCSEAASPARFTLDLDRTTKWAASGLPTQAGHRYGGQRSDRTADIWRPMVINHDINKQTTSSSKQQKEAIHWHNHSAISIHNPIFHL